MSNCFQMTRKGRDKPMALQAIDDEMRVAFGEPADPKKWLWQWYNLVGLGLAMGKTWEELRKMFGPDEDEDEDAFGERMLRVIDWLEQNFTADAWVER